MIDRARFVGLFSALMGGLPMHTSPLVQKLSSRVHIFVHPRDREAFTALFARVLSLQTRELNVGLDVPVLFVTFPDGGSFSVEFTDLAPNAGAPDDERALRGPWLEFRSLEPATTVAALRHAGIPAFRHRGSAHDYFVAPGGQVFRIVSLDYDGP